MVAKKEHSLKSSCPIACGLDLVGDHWTLLIVRDLMLFGRHEYRELLSSSEGISSNILSDRLLKLQQAELIRYTIPADNKRRKLYYLTRKGKDLVHVIIGLARWSLKYRLDLEELPKSLQSLTHLSTSEFVTQVFAELKQWEQSQGIADS